MALRSSRISLSVRRIGYSGTAFRASGVTFKFFSISLTVALFFFLSFSSFLFISSDDTSDHRPGFSNDLYRFGSYCRSILGLKSDPLKQRLDQNREQADDHHALAVACASHARKVKLENSKLGSVFA